MGMSDGCSISHCFSCGYCMWEPGKLKGMLECFLKSAGAGGGQYSGYNELVMDADAWQDHMPQTIEAVFYPTHSECDSSCRSKAETTHSKFLREFGVSSDDYPLLKLDVSDWNSPFSVA